MNVKIGENIKRLRKERDMTQEQLAAALEVSFQAVSRWELETTYPDIGLLPVIAGYFDITVDELLGVDVDRKQEEVKKILEQAHQFANKGKVYDAVCLLREKVKEYPNNAELLYTLASDLSFYKVSLDKEKEEFRKYTEEAAELYKRAIKYDKNNDFTYGCKQGLVYEYADLGEYEKARETALELPEVWTTSTLLLPIAAKDKDSKQSLHQVNVLILTDILIQELWGIENADYTVEQKLEIKLMMEKVMLAVLGENPCFYNVRLYNICIGIAWEYTKLKRYDEAMDTLEKALRYAEDFENRPESGKYSVFWLDRETDDPKGNTKNYDWTLYEDMLRHMTNMCSHDSCCEANERFKSIREKVNSRIAVK